MKCKKCNREKTDGSFYGFYYGKMTSSTRMPHDVPGEKKFLHLYEIGGARAAWICKRCLRKKFWTSGFGVSIIFTGIALLFIILRFGGNSEFMGGNDSSFLGGIILIFSLIAFFKILIVDVRGHPFNVAGDDQAIAAYKKGLRREGWDTFMNRVTSTKLDQKPLDVWVKHPTSAELEKQGLLVPVESWEREDPVQEVPEPEDPAVDGGLCWFCNKRDSDPNYKSVVLLKRKSGEKKKIAIPRCSTCKAVHRRVEKRTNTGCIITLSGVPVGFVLGIVLTRKWYMGLAFGLGCPAFIGLIVWTYKKIILKKHGTKNNDVLHDPHPMVKDLMESGWEPINQDTTFKSK
jgi:hypothetical protein